MGICEYCGAPIAPGEVVCSRCMAPVQDQNQKSEQADKKTRPASKLIVGIIVAAAIVIGITGYYIARPHIMYYKIMHGVDLDPGKTDKVAKYNEIDEENIMLAAQPGDVIDVHLIHDIQTYDRSEDLKKVMEVSNLTVSLSLTYTKELGNDEYEFPTVK